MVDNALRIKEISNVREILARGGSVIPVGPESSRIGEDFGKAEGSGTGREGFFLSETAGWEGVFLASSVLQLLAYRAAVLMGNDVDQPRNLAKSVTVE
jgi:glucosamine--fructose-6-phosphate aminotransferase (isomerizing)